MALKDEIRVCVFDAYGTLFDLDSAVAPAAAMLGDKAAGLNAIWRQKQLEYTWLRSLMQNHAPFDQVTRDALDYALESSEVDDPAVRAALLSSFDTLEAYPEVVEVLTALKERGLPCAILSNGEPVMLDKGVKAAGLGDLLDQVFSVEDVGVFKPDPRVYQMVCDHYDIAPRHVLFHSSNPWDAHAAADFGFHVHWINRAGKVTERLPGNITNIGDSLAITLKEV